MKRILYFAIGLACALLATELVLRTLPVATGYPYLPVNANNPVYRGIPLSPYTVSTGWNFRFARTGRLNDDGFNSTLSYRDVGRNVLMIGDSFVFSEALAPRENLTEVLGRKLGSTAVLTLGAPGCSLSDYLAMSKWGMARYHPDAVIYLLVNGDVIQGYLSSPGRHVFTLVAGVVRMDRRDRPALAGMKAALSKLKLFRYLYGNLGLISRLERISGLDSGPSGTVESEFTVQDIEKIDQASQFVLAELERIASRGRFLFLIDAKREPRIGERDIDRFADLAERGGWQVLRLQAAFDRYQRETGLRLDLRPIDGHWNAQAQVVAAEATLPRLDALLDAAAAGTAR